MINKNIKIQSFSKNHLDSKTYDCVIATLGYESRSIYLPSLCKNGKARHAIGFSHNRKLNYNSNKKWFSENGFVMTEPTDSEYSSEIGFILETLITKKEDPVYLFVDISSMNRFRLATILWRLLKTQFHNTVSIDFGYSVAAFSEPNRNDFSPIVQAKPVINEFAGWTNDNNLPITAIIGLGYEYNKAVGILEYIEPGESWAFVPASPDNRYDIEIESANKTLFWLMPENRKLNYRLEHPLDTFYNLESLVFGALKCSRPIILPFGPKIFTLYSLLVAAVHYPKVAVWRVSSDEYQEAIERKPSDYVLGLSVSLIPQSLNQHD